MPASFVLFCDVVNAGYACPVTATQDMQASENRFQAGGRGEDPSASRADRESHCCNERAHAMNIATISVPVVLLVRQLAVDAALVVLRGESASGELNFESEGVNGVAGGNP